MELKTKLRAAACHLAASTAAIALIVCVAVWRWYPLPYFFLDGGWQGVWLTLGVNLVLGSLLSLALFNGAKSHRTLICDYSVIAALQLAVLASGMWVVFSQRTAMVSFADGALYTVAAADLTSTGDRGRRIVAEAGTTPAWAFVALPREPAALNLLRTNALSTGRPLYLRGEYMKPLDASHSPILRSAASRYLGKVADTSTEEHRLFQFAEQQSGDSIAVLPLYCRYRDATIALDLNTGEVLDWLPVALDPGFGGRKSSLARAAAP